MEGRIKVVVFEVSPKFDKFLGGLLKSISYVDLIENNVNNTEEALGFILDKKPDIIIIGNDFPGKDSFYFTQIIRREAAPAQVIMIAEVLSSEIVRQAMRSGACDFISYKNLTVEELSMALERAAQLVTDERAIRGEVETKPEVKTQAQVRSTNREPARVVAVYSPKGGSGVSTITANLGTVLAKEGHKVLVIDGDFLFGDMGVLLNRPSNHSIADLVRFKENLEEDIIKDIITSGKVDLLAAPPSIEKSVELTGPVSETIIEKLSKLDYDILLINTNSHITDSTLVILEKADNVILIGTQEIATIRALRLFLDLMKTISIDFNKFEVVINRYEKDSVLTLAKINESLDIKITYTIPLDYATVLLANNLGIPFAVDQQSLAISKDISALAGFVLNGGAKSKNAKGLNALRDLTKKLSGRRSKKPSPA